jgi:hypothetical protein
MAHELVATLAIQPRQYLSLEQLFQLVTLFENDLM